MEDVSLYENTYFTGSIPNLSGDTPIGNVTYSLGGNDASLFTITNKLGVTGVASMEAKDFENPIDANTDNIYEITIIATDDDGNTAFTTREIVVINSIELTTFRLSAIDDLILPENTAYTGEAPVITGDFIGEMTYSLGNDANSGEDANSFTINAATGVVSMVARNFENREDANGDNVYQVTIVATDEDENYTSEYFQITITDVIEVTNLIINPIADVSIPANTFFTGVVPSTNGDFIGEIIYYLSGDDKIAFNINARTGVVTMAGRDFYNPLDANADNVYEIDIVVLDIDGNTDSTKQKITVVEDITIENQEFTIAENSPNATIVGDVQTKGNPTEFSITGGEVYDAFAIDNTGQITVADVNELDFETTTKYTLEVQTTKDIVESKTALITISIINAIEVATFTIDTIDNVSISENTLFTGSTPNLSGDTPI
jgi:hypothetical protein